MNKSRSRTELLGLPCGSFWRERMEHDVSISYLHTAYSIAYWLTRDTYLTRNRLHLC